MASLGRRASAFPVIYVAVSLFLALSMTSDALSTEETLSLGSQTTGLRTNPMTAPSTQIPVTPGEDRSAVTGSEEAELELGARMKLAEEANKLMFFLMHQGFSTLANALIDLRILPRLATLLSRGNEVTVLAPSDAAFFEFAESKCRNFLEGALAHHILVGRYMAEGLALQKIGIMIPAASGSMVVEVGEDPVRMSVVGKAEKDVNSAAVERPDAYFSKYLVVHGVDAILNGTCLEPATWRQS